ncbi:hypothetical protein HJFPF1_06257 [Paramyrothecium foliicola]|nr:hypothetical protein HJFPF1_06257 [Paramyrothecium foliicola]
MAFKNKDKDTLPSEKRAEDPKGETLREKATKKLHGKGANPSQLGDPISVKAETSDTVPTDGEQGSRQQKEASIAGRGSKWSGGQGDGEVTEDDASANREKRPSKI